MKNKKLNICIIILLTVIVLYFSLKDDYQKIIPLLFETNIIWLFIAYFFVLSYTFLKAVVTHNIILGFKKFNFIKTFKLQLMTFFFNAVTPFSSGGQPFQIYVLNKNKISLATSTTIVLQETIIHQISVSIMLIITYILNQIFNIYELNFTLLLFIILSFSINSILMILLVILSQGKKIDNVFGKVIINILAKLKIINDKEEKLKKWETSVSEFTVASKKLLQDKPKFIKLIFLNIVALFSLYLVPLLILFSLGNVTAFNGIEAIVLTSFVSIISCYIPLPGGALGQEYLFVLFFSKYVTIPLLTSLMLLWRFITYYVPMVIGAVIFNVSKKD